jgi:conjugative transfer region protein (TIGR03748 family)
MPSSVLRFLCIPVLLGSLLPGCTTTRAVPRLGEVASQGAVSRQDHHLVPVTRHGRYTLVELVPQSDERDLLRQVVDVSMAPMSDVSVGDAMRHVLQRSGYQLCDTPEAWQLYALPLPAAHLHLGPLMLRDALATLAGPAWELSVNELTRQVCFIQAKRRQALNQQSRLQQ